MNTIAGTTLAVHPLCLGGNVFGWNLDEAQSFAVLDAYVEAGGNFIDTADQYSFWKPGNVGGESERILGSWMKARGNRDELVIATKVGRLPGREGLGAGTVRAALTESLERLQTDRIDLYYAHADDPATALEETLGAFGAAQSEGTVRFVAASNYDGGRLAKALATPGARYVALQARYNLLDREPYESDQREIVMGAGISLIPYFSLASGYLTGKYLNQGFSGVRANAASQYDTVHGRAVVAALVDIANLRGCEASSIAIAWLLSHPEIPSTIASATSPHQLEALIAGTAIALTQEEIARLIRQSGP